MALSAVYFQEILCNKIRKGLTKIVFKMKEAQFSNIEFSRFSPVGFRRAVISRIIIMRFCLARWLVLHYLGWFLHRCIFHELLGLWEHRT